MTRINEASFVDAPAPVAPHHPVEVVTADGWRIQHIGPIKASMLLQEVTLTVGGPALAAVMRSLLFLATTGEVDERLAKIRSALDTGDYSAFGEILGDLGRFIRDSEAILPAMSQIIASIGTVRAAQWACNVLVVEHGRGGLSRKIGDEWVRVTSLTQLDDLLASEHPFKYYELFISAMELNLRPFFDAASSTSRSWLQSLAKHLRPRPSPDPTPTDTPLSSP